MKSLIKYKIHLAAVATITLWGLFSYAYIGVEDGSSGLSLLGWVHVLFHIPGLFLVTQCKGTYTNADLPVVAMISWLIYVTLAVGIVHAAHLFFGSKKTT